MCVKYIWNIKARTVNVVCQNNFLQPILDTSTQDIHSRVQARFTNFKKLPFYEVYNGEQLIKFVLCREFR